jgi:chromosomal replication initiation ATPase DnaA
MNPLTQQRIDEMAAELRDVANFMKVRLCMGLTPEQVIAQCDTLFSIADQLDEADAPRGFQPRLIMGGLSEDLQPEAPRPTIQQIKVATCSRLHLSMDQLVHGGKSKPYVFARHIAMHIAREMTGRSWKVIGNAFGGMDHASVINANDNVKAALAEADQETIDAVAEITKTVMARVYQDIQRERGAG